MERRNKLIPLQQSLQPPESYRGAGVLALKAELRECLQGGREAATCSPTPSVPAWRPLTHPAR